MENTNTELITSKNCVSSQNVYSGDHELSTIIREAIVFLGCEGRAYFKVTLPAAPAGAAVTRAELILTSPVYDLVNVNNFTLYQTSAFDPASLTWSNQPSILSTVSAEQLNGSVGKLNIDFTELYEDDLSEKTLYLAFYPVIRNVDDGNGGCYCETVQTSFCSENYSAGKPVANIYYVSSEKLLQNTEYLEIDMGRSGKGQINLFNGNLSFTHTLFNIAGTSLPVSIATVHNRDVESSGVTWGNRFFSPLQTLVYNENSGSGEPKAVYTDASGYKHYFKQSSYINENNQSVSALRDTAGLNLICTESDEISGGHEMMDKSGNKMLFDSSGKLVRIDDRLGNFVQYIYSGGLPTKIKAGSSEYKNSESKLYVYNLEYSGNRLYKVTGPSNQSVTFSSSKATYSDEKSTTFSFSSGKLTRVSDSDGLICEITYRSGTGRVSSVSYYSNYSSYGETTVTSKTLIDKVNITYTGRTTTVTGRDGSKTIYNFDDSGKAILTYAKAPGSSGLPIPSSTPCIVNRYKGEEEKFGIVIPEYREITVRTDNDCRSNIVGDPNFNNLVIGFNSASETWSTTAQGTLTSSSTSFIPGTRSVYFTGTGVGKGAYQFINFGNISHKENLLVFSAWAKAQFAVRSTDKTRFEISVDATYENGQKITYSCKYNHKITDWQFAAVTVETMKLFPKTNGTGYESSMLSKVGLWLDFAGNNGSCYFNAPRLEFCNGEITEYMLTEAEDENETNYVMLETSVNNGTHTVTTTHNKYFLPTKEVIRDKSGTEFKTDITYSTDGRLKSKLDYHGTQTSYSYTTGGKIKRKAVQMGLNGKTIQTKKNYSEDEKHVSSEADENNSWVIYDYDSTTDQLTKVTTSNSQEYNYTYNSALELTGISSTVGGTSNANHIGYNMGYVTELHGKTPSTNESKRDFRFTYDWKGRNKKITVAEEDLVEYSYTDNYQTNKHTATASYPTFESVTVDYDGRQNPLKVTYTGAGNTQEVLCENTYRSDGLLSHSKDNESGLKYIYDYLPNGNVYHIYKVPKDFNGTPNDSHFRATFGYSGNDDSRLINYTYRDPEEPGSINSYTVQYTAKGSGMVYPENTPELVSLSGKHSDMVTYDILSRVTDRTFTALTSNTKLTDDSYEYFDLGQDSINNSSYSVTGTRVKSVNHFRTYTGSYSHTDYLYDSGGNITEICEIKETEQPPQNPDNPGTFFTAEVEHTINYTYDGLGRITSETEQGKRDLRKEYTYDSRGNILSKKVFKKSADNGAWILDKKENYAYNNNGWKDQLASRTITTYGYDPVSCTECDCTESESFSYSSLGNPTMYRGHSLVWDRVTLLKQYGFNTFTYSSDGMRLTKNGITYDYLGDRLLKETRDDCVIRYYYGLDGIVGFNLRASASQSGKDYYLIKNLQGDVIRVCDDSGAVYARYMYDAFGNCEIQDNLNNIANINPIRYRGYYFDSETGLYYLQTRYYDPETGRFISPDSLNYLEPERINGLNLYAYCYNNPVMYSDPTGKFPFLALIIISAILIGGGATIGGIASAKNDQNVWEGIGKGAAAGALLSASIILAVSGFYVPGGFTSVLGSMMTYYGFSTVANFLEVAVMQGKYSASGGSDFWSGAIDVFDSMLINSGKVAAGYLVFLGYPIIGTRLFSKTLTVKAFSGNLIDNVKNYKFSTAFNMTMSSFWKSKSSKFGLLTGGFFTGLQIISLLKTIFTTPDFDNSKWTLV